MMLTYIRRITEVIVALLIISITCSNISSIGRVEASESRRIIDTLDREGMMRGINGLPWGYRIEYYNEARLPWEYVSVWGFWKEYLGNTRATEGYLQLKCRKDIVGGYVNFEEPISDGFALNAVWNGYNAEYAALLTNRKSRGLEGISMVFTFNDTESNIDAFIEELRAILGDGSLSSHKMKAQEQWTFPNVTCTLKTEGSSGFMVASIRIVNSETAGMPYNVEHIDTTGMIYVLQ